MAFIDHLYTFINLAVLTGFGLFVTLVTTKKSDSVTLAGTKFFMFISRWLAVDFCHTKAIYDFYKSMGGGQKTPKFA